MLFGHPLKWYSWLWASTWIPVFRCHAASLYTFAAPFFLPSSPSFNVGTRPVLHFSPAWLCSFGGRELSLAWSIAWQSKTRTRSELQKWIKKKWFLLLVKVRDHFTLWLRLRNELRHKLTQQKTMVNVSARWCRDPNQVLLLHHRIILGL